MCNGPFEKISQQTDLYNYGVNFGGIEDLRKPFYPKRMMFYIISDNLYFKAGVTRFLTEYYCSPISSNNHCGVFIKTYNLNQVSSLRSDFVLNNDVINFNVVIVDKEFINSVSFIFSHEHLCQAFFVASDEFTQANLKKIIECKNPQTGKNTKMPCFILFGGLNQREKRVCQYLYKGYTPKFIGMMLGVHQKTISNYKTKIMKKTGCLNKADFNKALIDYYRFCITD